MGAAMTITIPPEALEAGARAITMALILAVEEDCRALALTDDERAELARAAFLAMIEAWPDALIRADTLEEAAKELDRWGDIYGDNAAAVIRAMKERT